MLDPVDADHRVEAVVRERQWGVHICMRERNAPNLEQGLNVGGVHLVPGGAHAV